MKVQEITINEAPELPETVYKYRKWEDYQKTIITAKQFF
jgi:hypothetical protein